MRWVLSLILCHTACGGHTAAVSVPGSGGGRVTTEADTGTGGGAGTPSTAPPQKLLAQMIAGGSGHVCVVRRDSTVQCWPCGNFPVTVAGISNAVAVATGGGGNTCALLSDGTIQCWTVAGNSSSTPTPISGINSASAVAVGAEFGCALLSGGKVECWGRNLEGELGIGFLSTRSLNLVPVSGITNAVAVTAGGYFACALLGDGGVQCWGSGVLGDGSTTQSAVPVKVSSVSTATAVAAASAAYETCALLSDGTVQCWGEYISGVPNLPDGGSLLPVTVSGITNAVDIATNGGLVCAVFRDGTVQCKASNSSGDGAPATISGISNAVAVAEGCSSCALLSDGTVQCWIDTGVPVTVTEN